MPRLAKLQSEHPDKLVAIGPHCQDVPQSDVVALCKQLKLNFTVTNGGEVAGINFQGIPKVFAFDHTGELIFNGRPDEGFEKTLQAALKAAPDWLVGEHTYTKLKSQATAIASRKGLGKALAECRKLKDDADATTAQEAARLLEKLLPWAQGQLDRARKLETENPPKALEQYGKLSILFQGDALGTEAADAAKRMKADPQVQKEIAAAQLLSRVEQAGEAMRPCRYGEPLDLAACGACQKKNAGTLTPLLASLRELLKKYEGTHAATGAAELLKTWGG